MKEIFGTISIKILTISRSDMFKAIYNYPGEKRGKSLRKHIKKTLNGSSQGGILEIRKKHKQ